MQPSERILDADAIQISDTAPASAVHPSGAQPETDAYEEEESHVHLAPQSIWPMTVAGGVALGTAGLVTTPVFSLIGIILLLFGIIMWVQELRHELH